MGFGLRDESLIKPRRNLHGYHSPHPPYCGQWLILHHKGGYLSPWPPSFVVLLFGSLELLRPGPASESGHRAASAHDTAGLKASLVSQESPS